MTKACLERGCWRIPPAGQARCIVHGPKPEPGAETRRMTEWEAVKRQHREDVVTRRLVREVQAETAAFYAKFPELNHVQEATVAR